MPNHEYAHRRYEVSRIFHFDRTIFSPHPYTQIIPISASFRNKNSNDFTPCPPGDVPPVLSSFPSPIPEELTRRYNEYVSRRWSGTSLLSNGASSRPFSFFFFFFFYLRRERKDFPRGREKGSPEGGRMRVSFTITDEQMQAW